MERKTALITGASSGIGKELAKIHASRGGNLVIVARNEERLRELKEDIEKNYGVKVHVIQKDLSLSATPKVIYDEVKALGIEIDYLINNAGFGNCKKFHEYDIEKDTQMLSVNIISVVELTKLFLPEFIKRGHGKILNVSSIGALVPGPMQAVYCATKAFVSSFGNAVWKEIESTGVTITTLMPGATDTGFAKKANAQNTPLFAKTVDPYTVALAGYNGMLKGKLNVIAGVGVFQRINLMFSPLIPKKMILNIVSNMQTEK